MHALKTPRLHQQRPRQRLSRPGASARQPGPCRFARVDVESQLPVRADHRENDCDVGPLRGQLDLGRIGDVHGFPLVQPLGATLKLNLLGC
jgi:hypothetical protein